MILIGLGSNLSSVIGSPAQTLRAALEDLQKRHIKVEGTSRFYRTPAWPDPNDPPFVNAVARVSTDLAPAALLNQLHEVEAAFGRRRGIANAPRTLDLDLLDYDGRVETGPPVLPHPRLSERAFVLVPLSDVAPSWVHPVAGQSVTSLLARTDSRDVVPLDS
jgi:2-amino-4-hydroxy-6-hydroxymethyldihydropteridine diphosphokinase